MLYVVKTSGGYACCCGSFRHQWKMNVQNHVESIHFPGHFKWNCEVCGEEAKTRNILAKHKSKFHPKNPSAANFLMYWLNLDLSIHISKRLKFFWNPSFMGWSVVQALTPHLWLAMKTSFNMSFARRAAISALVVGSAIVGRWTCKTTSRAFIFPDTSSGTATSVESKPKLEMDFRSTNLSFTAKRVTLTDHFNEIKWNISVCSNHLLDHLLECDSDLLF